MEPRRGEKTECVCCCFGLGETEGEKKAAAARIAIAIAASTNLNLPPSSYPRHHHQESREVSPPLMREWTARDRLVSGSHIPVTRPGS